MAMIGILLGPIVSIMYATGLTLAAAVRASSL
jgi:hypothetical protein